MRPGKLVLIILGAVLALVGLGFVAGGGTLVWANATQRETLPSTSASGAVVALDRRDLGT